MGIHLSEHSCFKGNLIALFICIHVKSLHFERVLQFYRHFWLKNKVPSQKEFYCIFLQINSSLPLVWRLRVLGSLERQ